MRMTETESRPDWREIVLSVQCPVSGGCGANVGHMCIDLGQSGSKTARLDFHSARKFAAKSVWELGKIEKIDEHIAEDLDKLVAVLATAHSATLTLSAGGTMPATILIGGTANSLFQEWTGPNGTGTVLPNAGTIAYTSSNTIVATVDPASGIATGVTAGTAVISGTDPVNSLTASDTLTVNAPPPPTAQSETLTLTAN